MKLNSECKITGKNIILIPYRSHHVPKYHEWMKSEELQTLTASEPLTLDEEYEMQKSWQVDENKCTFIVLDKLQFQQSQNEIDSMIGDTNIFIVDKETATGEIEIMIAEQKARGRKLGWEAVILMMIYGIKHICLKKFVAKVSVDNPISMMFNKIGFQQTSVSDVFREVTLEKVVCNDWVKWLDEQSNYEISSC